MRAILRGKFVVDNIRAMSDDAAIVVENGIVADTGNYKDVAACNAGAEVREFDGILCPPLINAHTHLELSALRNGQFHHSDFVDWVMKLVDTRTSMISVDVRPDCVRAKNEAEEKGTGFFVNVGNDFELNRSLGDNQLFQFEQLGINGSLSEKVFGRASEMILNDSSVTAALAVHSPYSVSPELMKSIKAFNNGRGAVTSVHLAETSDELEFVMSGTGRMADLLNVRVGKWSFEPPGVSPVQYLDSLGVLDEKTLSVHCVFVNEDDIRVMRKRGTAVAVCARSNRELSGNVPPVGEFVRQGVRVLIGTDSRASSPDIDMFAEMAAFYSEFSGVMTPEQVFRAATIEAAEFLGIRERHGTIEPGHPAGIVYVPFDGKREEAMEYLVSSAAGNSRRVRL